MGLNMEDKAPQTKPLIYIITAIISALAIIAAALLSNDTVVSLLLRGLRTKTINISADQFSSGTAAYLSGNDMLTFEAYKSIVGPGDTTEDQLLRSFFSFYLGDVPKDAVLVEARLNIPYGIEGYPENLGALTLREYGFGQYGQEAFYGIPTSGWSAVWSNGAKLTANCRNQSSCGTLTTHNEELQELIQTAVPKRWVQFAFYFDSNVVIPDQKMDSVILAGLPQLVLKYYIPVEPHD